MSKETPDTNPEPVLNIPKNEAENPSNEKVEEEQVTNFFAKIPDNNREEVTVEIQNYIESHDDESQKGWGSLMEFIAKFFQDMQFDMDEDLSISEPENDEIPEDNVIEPTAKEEVNSPKSFIEQLKGNFHWPVIGPISSHFGKRKAPKKGASTNHGGIDIAVPAGTPIMPTQSGTISQIGYDSKSGNYIKINHPDGTQSVYCHLKSKPSLKAGQDVSINTPIGKVGSTGVSTGPHLHFEIRYNEQKIDPEELLA